MEVAGKIAKRLAYGLNFHPKKAINSGIEATVDTSEDQLLNFKVPLD